MNLVSLSVFMCGQKQKKLEGSVLDLSLWSVLHDGSDLSEGKGSFKRFLKVQSIRETGRKQ